MKKLMLLFALCAGVSAFGETYYAQDDAALTNCPVNTKWYTDRTYSTLAPDDVQIGPSITNVLTDGHVLKSVHKKEEFKGALLEIGTQNGPAGYLFANKSQTVLLGQCHLYSGTLAYNRDGDMTIGNGSTVTVFPHSGTDGLVPSIWCQNIGTPTRNMIVSGVFSSESDAVLQVLMGFNDGATLVPYQKYNGDFSSFKGGLVAVRPRRKALPSETSLGDNRYRLILDSESALGDQSAEREDALTLQHGVIFEMSSAVTQSDKRGIVFDAGEGLTNLLGTETVGDWTMKAPCKGGAGATLEKVDAGTVTIDNGSELSFATVKATAGVLVISNGVTFTDNVFLTADAGATLHYPSSIKDMVTVDETCEGNVIEDGEPAGHTVTISWPIDGSAFKSVQYKIGSGELQTAENGADISVDDGALFTIVATVADWYLASGTVTEQSITDDQDFELTAAIVSAAAIDKFATAAEAAAALRITNAAFAGTKAGLKSVTGWAPNRATVDDVNDMTFNPENTAAEAYLLNCDVKDVEDVKKTFRFSEIIPGQIPQIDGSGFNGDIVYLGAAALDGDWQPATTAHFFYKAVLVLKTFAD